MSLIQISEMQEGQTPITVFEIRGRINLGNYKELEQAAQQAYDNGMRNLVLDFSGLESLTSIGIRTLITVQKILAKNEGGKLKLAGVIPPIRDMLEMAGVAQFLDMHDTTAEAVAAF
jgi:anti-sigma B factor antagonist